MDDLAVIEECYKKYIKNLKHWVPDGIIKVDLKLLNELDLLHFHDPSKRDEHALSRYFHVFETEEKITLINEQFVIWIVPEKTQNSPMTYALIATNQADFPHMEAAFTAHGVYNNSWLVLRVLEKILFEIQENEELIKRYKKK